MKWTASALPTGGSVRQIVQGMGGEGTPDLFSVEQTDTGSISLIRALTSSGQQIWQVPFADGLFSASPAESGGLILSAADTNSGQTYVTTLDPLTGVLMSRYNSPGGTINVGAIHPSGTVLLTQYDAQDSFGINSSPSVVGLDPQTGAATFHIPLPLFASQPSTPEVSGAGCNGLPPVLLNGSDFGSLPIVAEDGGFYFLVDSNASTEIRADESGSGILLGLRNKLYLGGRSG